MENHIFAVSIRAIASTSCLHARSVAQACPSATMTRTLLSVVFVLQNIDRAANVTMAGWLSGRRALDVSSDVRVFPTASIR